MVKNLRILFILLLSIVFSSETVFGEENRSKPFEINNTKRQEHRPRKPAMNKSVSAFYEDGILEIQFLSPEGESHVEILNLNNSVCWEENIDTEYPAAIFIPEEYGTYQIDIITSKGNHYVGYLTF